MSFLTDLENFPKDILKPVETRVTTVEGKKLLEYKKEGSHVTVDTGEMSYGFCEDTNPDRDLYKIEEGLFISSQDGASNYEELKRNGVTHILNVATGVQNVFPGEFTYKHVELLDVPDTEIKPHFQEIFQFIENGCMDGVVLVHCNAGISRSSTVVIAYLMKKRKNTLNSALKLVRDARPCVKPNDGFWQQLVAYEKELVSITVDE